MSDKFEGHTPGPWYYDARTVKGGDRGEYVCEVLGAASNVSHQADARLIAAAPDLLRERNQLREQLADLQRSYDALARKATALEEEREYNASLVFGRDAQIESLRVELDRVKAELGTRGWMP